jgi:hypothetical protein
MRGKVRWIPMPGTCLNPDEGGYIEPVNWRGTLAGSDCWSFKPALVSLATVAVLMFICQLPGSFSFLVIPLSLLGYAIASLVIVVIAVYCVIKRRPRKGASIFLVLLLPVLLWSPLIRLAELVHLGLTVSFGAGELGETSKSYGDDFVVYDWSVGLAGANTFLIHDVTDEIALPMAQHTHPASSENGWGEECAGKVRRLMSHYYVCEF